MAKSVKTGSEALGQLVQHRRAHLGMTRRDLVDASGLSYPYVSQIETGYRMPSSVAARSLAGALRMSLDDLFKDNPPTPGAEPLVAGDTKEGPQPTANQVVDDVVQRLEQLPADARLDAMAIVQKRLMRGLINDYPHPGSGST